MLVASLLLACGQTPTAPPPTRLELDPIADATVIAVAAGFGLVSQAIYRRPRTRRRALRGCR